MPRTKVKLAFIENHKARKSSFMKRKECLKRKLEELSILCGVEACGILYSPFEPQLEVWPDNNIVVQNMLSAFMKLSPLERNRYMVNQDSYIKERINKAMDQINKQIMVNREIAIDNLMSECLRGKVSLASLNLTHLNNLVSLAGNKLSEIEERIEILKSETPAAAPHLESRLTQPQEVVGGSNTASCMLAEGMNADVYVPVMENRGGSYEMQTTGCYVPDRIGDKFMKHDS